ncbi:hypothetical protein B0T16DRAFT_498674 [Cercophora newfieldiana]|uniref:Uncharacterized protein n=1 Tax=Cercophora newfieldiana TaxID=92897 RepID=A0AA39YMB6_9PEZI|nr:hypothetical protein B0T16DRAFT_498674 [Cercophora newfieldiana]
MSAPAPAAPPPKGLVPTAPGVKLRGYAQLFLFIAAAVISTFAVVGCVSKSPGIPEIYVLELNLEECQTKIRTGYFDPGICAIRNDDVGRAECAPSRYGTEVDDIFDSIFTTSISDVGKQAECPRREVLQAALDFQWRIFQALEIGALVTLLASGVFASLWGYGKMHREKRKRAVNEKNAADTKAYANAVKLYAYDKTSSPEPPKAPVPEIVGTAHTWKRYAEAAFLVLFVLSTTLSGAAALSVWQIASALEYASQSKLFGGKIPIRAGRMLIGLQGAVAIFTLLLFIIISIFQFRRKEKKTNAYLWAFCKDSFKLTPEQAKSAAPATLAAPVAPVGVAAAPVAGVAAGPTAGPMPPTGAVAAKPPSAAPVMHFNFVSPSSNNQWHPSNSSPERRAAAAADGVAPIQGVENPVVVQGWGHYVGGVPVYGPPVIPTSQAPQEGVDTQIHGVEGGPVNVSEVEEVPKTQQMFPPSTEDDMVHDVPSGFGQSRQGETIPNNSSEPREPVMPIMVGEGTEWMGSRSPEPVSPEPGAPEAGTPSEPSHDTPPKQPTSAATRVDADGPAFPYMSGAIQRDLNPPSQVVNDTTPSQPAASSSNPIVNEWASAPTPGTAPKHFGPTRSTRAADVLRGFSQPEPDNDFFRDPNIRYCGPAVEVTDDEDESIYNGVPKIAHGIPFVRARTVHIGGPGVNV